jgi:hypothetical protein
MVFSLLIDNFAQTSESILSTDRLTTEIPYPTTARTGEYSFLI